MTLVQQDLPAGVEIKETEIYLFSRGEEIPTNLSPRHMRITRAEAQEFVKLSHLGDHAKGTVPARAVWALTPKTLLAAKDPVRFQHPVEVALDDEGAVLAIRDEGALVPDVVKDVINEMTFAPAIEKGSPVASTIMVNLADFFADAR